MWTTFTDVVISGGDRAEPGWGLGRVREESAEVPW